jgi:hypothetical protein
MSFGKFPTLFSPNLKSTGYQFGLLIYHPAFRRQRTRAIPLAWIVAFTETFERAKEAMPGTFDLMNKGITILAESVRLVDKEQRLVEVTVDNHDGGIVDGAHTAKIIEESNGDGDTNPEHYVEVYIRTGIPQNIATDIARGLNTGIQVAKQSIYHIEGVFNWLQEDISKQSYKVSFPGGSPTTRSTTFVIWLGFGGLEHFRFSEW